MIALSGAPLHSVPVIRQHREHGESAYSGWGRLNSAIQGLYCTLAYHLWKPDTSYIDRLETDPVAWVKPNPSQLS